MEHCQSPVQMGGATFSNPSEFQFLARWAFDSRLKSRLERFAVSSTYKFTIKSNISSHQSIKSTPRREDSESPKESEVCDDVIQEDLHDADNTFVEPTSQSLLCTQDCTKVIVNLREGPISGEELSRLSEEDIISFINSGSDDVIFNFCESVCSTLQHQQKFVPILYEKVLLPKIKDPKFMTCSRTLLPTIKKTFDAFPAEGCNCLLLPLLGEHDLHCKLDPFLTVLESGSKQTILKSLLEGNIVVLQEHHIPLIQSLLVPSLNKDTIEKLIDLLLASGSNFCKSSSFGKLLVCVTEKIGQFLDSEVKEKLFCAIQAHKSIQRARIMKAFQSISS